MATEENWENVLRTNRSSIQMLIELDNGLWGELKSRNMFTKRQLECIWPPGKKMTADRVETLLEMLEKKTFPTFKKFCDALEVTGQGRVVKEALSSAREPDNDLSPATPGDTVDGHLTSSFCLPLSPWKHRCLTEHWNDIVENMVTDADVFGKLTEKKVFTELQLKSLKDHQEESKRNEMLLHGLEKSSDGQYDAFCDIMIATQQLVIARYLTPVLAGKVTSRCAQGAGSSQSVLGNESLDTMQSLSPGDETCPPLVRLPAGRAESFPTELSQIKFGVISEEFLKRVAANVRDEIAYKCDRRPLGLAIIINNEYFPNFKRRVGATEDRKCLEFLFNMLHFETRVYEDFSTTEIVQLLKSESTADRNKDFDVFVLFLLSHGRKNEIYGMDEKTISIDQITTIFDGKNCISLLNKPKLFFIQACQGEANTKGITETDSAAVPSAHLTTETPLETKLEHPKPDMESPQGYILGSSEELSDDLERNLRIEDEGQAIRSNDPTLDSGINLENPDCETLHKETETKLKCTESRSENSSPSLLPEEDVTWKQKELAESLKKSLGMEAGDHQCIQCDDSAVIATHEKADMAIVYSTTGGYVALRDSEKGSFFVQCMVDVFARRAHEDDLQSMLTEVIKRLHDQPMMQKQIGEKRDTLRRKVYLLPRQSLRSTEGQ